MLSARPLVQFAMLQSRVAFLGGILLFELLAKFAEAATHSLLLLFAEQGAWTRSPQNLLELLNHVLLQLVSTPIPDRFTVLHLQWTSLATSSVGRISLQLTV